MAIMGLILHAKDIEAGKPLTSVVSNHLQMPFLEVETNNGQLAVEMAAHMPSPRVFRSHLPLQSFSGSLEEES